MSSVTQNCVRVATVTLPYPPPIHSRCILQPCTNSEIDLWPITWKMTSFYPVMTSRQNVLIITHLHTVKKQARSEWSDSQNWISWSQSASGGLCWTKWNSLQALCSWKWARWISGKHNLSDDSYRQQGGKKWLLEAKPSKYDFISKMKTRVNIKKYSRGFPLNKWQSLKPV